MAGRNGRESIPDLASAEDEKLPDNPTVRLSILPRLRDVERIRVEILMLHGTDIDNVHVRELRFE